MISILSVDAQVILATTALLPSVVAVMNLAIFSKTVPTTFLHQEHNVTTEDLIQGIHTPTTGGTDHTPIMVTDIGVITADHSPAPICTVTEVTTLEGPPHDLLPATATAHATPQLMDAPAMIKTGIVAPHPTLTISPGGTTPQTKAALTPAAPTMNHKFSAHEDKAMPKTLNHKCHHPKTVTIQDSPSDSSSDSDSDSDPLNY